MNGVIDSNAAEPRAADDTDIFAVTVTDVALERAACAGPENVTQFTAALCSVMADCGS